MGEPRETDSTRMDRGGPGWDRDLLSWWASDRWDVRGGWVHVVVPEVPDHEEVVVHRQARVGHVLPVVEEAFHVPRETPLQCGWQ